MKNTLAILLLALGAMPAAACAHSRLGAIEVYDRTAGRFLAVHDHAGRHYVAGEPGHEYEIVLRNHSGGRVLAVTSVDGVNVISGQTAAPDQTGYVLPAYGSTTIGGWRKSMDEVAAFYFTKHANSYAARTGRPFDVGVIGVALFRERPVWREPYGWREDEAMRDSAAGAPGAAPPELQSRRQENAESRAEEKLGTGHGRREHSGATHTQFERASAEPDVILSIYYDTRANLVAQGVIPRGREYAQHRPRPFPNGFTPDP
jgi:hypothetical protein